MKTLDASTLFTSNFQILSESGVGVMLVQAREPSRVIDLLYEHAFTNDYKAFKTWDCRDGWATFDMKNTEAEPIKDRSIEPYAALKAIGDVDNNGKNEWKDGIFVVMYPHWVLPKNLNYIQCLKHYVADFSKKTKQRLVLVVPEGFQLPIELANDIPVLPLDLPGRGELAAIFHRTLKPILDKKNVTLAKVCNQQDVDRIVGLGSGMTEAEFALAVSKAIVTHKAKLPKTDKEHIPADDYCNVIKAAKVEVVRRSTVLELMPATKLEDIGGMENFKEWILERSRCFTPEARNFGVDRPKGCILIGPPGTGKTLGGKVVGSVLTVPVVKVDIGAAFNSLIGESEKAATSAINLLRAMAPVVAVIDEVDKAGIDPRQASGDSGVGKRILGKFLTEMQEGEAEIFWVLTANRATGLPAELTRKGRADEVFSVLPPNATERLAVLEIHLRKRKQDPKGIKDLALAVEKSNGYVQAEIESAVKEAVVKAFHTGCEVTGALIAQQLELMRPISVAFAEDFAEMTVWAENNARPASKADGSVALAAATGRSRTRAVTA